MQGLGIVTNAQLLASGQEPLIKLEAYVNGNWIEPWINLCDAPTERLREALTDGGLEIWASATDLTHWTEADAGGACGIAQEAVIVHGGTYSCRLYTTAGGDWASIQQDFTLTPENICALSFWYIKGAHASSTLRLYVYDTGSNVSLKSDGTWQAGVLPILMTDSAVWKLFELGFVAHASYSNYRIRIYKSHAAGGAISYYVDDFSIEETIELNVESGQLGNYLESASISLGGAAMTPNPVEGTWSATLFNENGVFHPQHPTSSYKDWLTTERLTRISVGATYGGVDYYWPRIIGYMDTPKFSIPDYRVAISGGDYMKRLRETELRMPNNYWGSTWTTSSISSDGLAAVEIYAEADAMEIGGGEANNVANWVATACTFVSFADVGGGSAFVGRLTAVTPLTFAYVANVNVGNAVAGNEYKVRFKYRGVGEDGSNSIQVRIYQASGLCKMQAYHPTDDWTDDFLVFTALDTGVIEMWVVCTPGITDLRLDEFSIRGFTPYWERYYDLRAQDANEKGIHHVTLDPTTGAEDVWQGEGDEGWYYEKDAEAGPDPPAHPAGIVFFDPNKTVAAGANNLVIYYYLATTPEDAVARLLYLAGVFDPSTYAPYASEAAAKAAMVAAPGYAATGITIDKIWFEPGTTCLEAIKKLCERGTDAGVPYVFYFTYDGQPVFKPRPMVGAAVFAFTDPKHIGSVDTYQDRNEIKNRIIIEGMRQAEPVEHEETRHSVWIGEDSDVASIAVYGERTLTIKNHLFQAQAPIDAMCLWLKNALKDPKWYSNLKMPYNPVPLELGDSISWIERLSPTLNIAAQTGLIRDIKIDNFNMTYKCEL